jgi:hypothetical protein
MPGLSIAVDRDGNAYTAGYSGDEKNVDAKLTKFDPKGALVDEVFLGGPLTNDVGYGIDLVTPQSNSGVLMAGQTYTPEWDMKPAPAGCDVTYGGGGDGYVMFNPQPDPPGV